MKVITCIQDYESETLLRKYVRESYFNVSVSTTTVKKVARALEYKNSLTWNDMHEFFDMRFAWKDPDKLPKAEGFYKDTPKLTCSIDLNALNNIKLGYMDSIPRMLEIADECMSWVLSDPLLDDKPMSQHRLDFITLQAVKEDQSEMEQAELRAADPAFTKKEAAELLDKAKAKAGRRYDMSKLKLLGRDGTYRQGDERTVYARKINVHYGNSPSRVDLFWSSWGERTSKADVLRIMQEDVSRAKTLARWDSENKSEDDA